MKRAGRIFFLMAFFFAAVLRAGPQDAIEVDREIRILDEKAKDFIDLERAEKQKKNFDADRLEFIKERRAREERNELQRRRYVEQKVKVTDDRGYSNYLKETVEEEKRQKSRLSQFLMEQQRLRRAIERYREKVPDYKEVDLNEKGLSGSE